MANYCARRRANESQSASGRRFIGITYLHGDKFFRRLGGLSTHLPGLDDTHDHLASPLDSFEGRRCRSVMIVLDSLDLLEDLGTDPAHLQRQVLSF